MIRDITYNGKSLTDFGVFADFSEALNTSAYVVDSWTIPGRSGDLLSPENRYENKKRPFRCFIRKDFQTNFDNLIDFLTSTKGTYQRLEIAAEPDVYMMAAFYNAVSPEMHPFLRSGTFDLVFDCMPQRFLKIGEQSIPVAAGSSVTLANPTRKPARPLLSVSEMTSGGSIEIGDQTITVAANSANTMLIDTDLMRAYMVTAGGVVHSLDAFVTMPDNYVEIPAGQSVITATGVSVSVTPRWWKL